MFIYRSQVRVSRCYSLTLQSTVQKLGHTSLCTLQNSSQSSPHQRTAAGVSSKTALMQQNTSFHNKHWQRSSPKEKTLSYKTLTTQQHYKMDHYCQWSSCCLFIWHKPRFSSNTKEDASLLHGLCCLTVRVADSYLAMLQSLQGFASVILHKMKLKSFLQHDVKLYMFTRNTVHAVLSSYRNTTVFSKPSLIHTLCSLSCSSHGNKLAQTSNIALTSIWSYDWWWTVLYFLHKDASSYVIATV